MDKWQPCPLAPHSFTPNPTITTLPCAHAPTRPQARAHSCEHTRRDRWTRRPRTLRRTARDTLKAHARPDLPRAHPPALPRGASGARAGARTPLLGPGVGDCPAARPPPLSRPAPVRSGRAPAPGHSPARRRARLRAEGPAHGPAGGRQEQWVPHELAAPRPHAGPLGSAAACAGPRARSRPSPPRGRAAPCARARCRHAGSGGDGAAPSPRADLPLSQARLAEDPLPIFKLGKLRPRLTQRVRPNMSPSQALDI